MQFFEHQDRARKSTGKLVLLFILGYVATCTSIWLILALIWSLSDGPQEDFKRALLDPQVILWTIGPVTAIVALTSLVKLAQLSGDGAKVAKLFGGVEVDPATAEPAERQLLNVVEEMAIASGCPVPRLFVIPDESINAFAAGSRPSDAAIGITSQALHAFERDELQGVIAHEFSHIFHGDMRMNTRISAAIAGIMALGVTGWILVRYVGPALARTGGRKNNGAAVGLAIILAGLALVVIGGVGTFIGQVIQAAISRQREYLADASAVQYTRNPRGLANALRRIGEWRKTVVANPNVATCSHFFFCSAVDSVFSTHPSLEERIRRIEALPGMAEIGSGGAAGQSMAQRSAAIAATAATAADRQRAASGADRGPGIPIPAVGEALNPLAKAMGGIGAISPERLLWAAAMLESLPKDIQGGVRSPAGAMAAFCLMLGAGPDDDATLGGDDAGLVAALERLRPALSTVSRRERLVIADLAMPALRRVSVADYKRFRKGLSLLVKRDRRVTLSEWVLLNALRYHVEAPMADAAGAAAGGAPPRNASLLALRGPVVSYLGILAMNGSDPDGAAHALAAGLKQLGIGGGGLPSTDQVSLDALSKALGQLASLRDADRDSLLRAALTVVQHDRHVSDDECDLVRVLCDAIGAPLPPLDAAPAAA